MDAAIGVLSPPDLPSGDFIDYAQEAESSGFDELWVVEDCFLRGGIAQAAVALARTRRIQVGIGIMPAGARNAAFACLEIATLAELFPGRLLVGIGHGMPDWMRQVGAWPASPLTLLREYITSIKSILAGERVTVSGQYVALQEVQLARPPKSVPPVFAGVRGPRSIAVSGAVADGTILAEPVTPEYLKRTRELLGAAAARHQIVAYNVAAVDDDPATARAVARPSLKWIGDPEWAPHLAGLPFAKELASLRAASATREDFASRLPDHWVDELAVVGSPAQARSRLDVLSAAGADHLVLSPAGPNPLTALGSLSRVLAGRST